MHCCPIECGKFQKKMTFDGTGEIFHFLSAEFSFFWVRNFNFLSTEIPFSERRIQGSLFRALLQFLSAKFTFYENIISQKHNFKFLVQNLHFLSTEFRVVYLAQFFSSKISFSGCRIFYFWAQKFDFFRREICIFWVWNLYYWSTEFWTVWVTHTCVANKQ